MTSIRMRRITLFTGSGRLFPAVRWEVEDPITPQNEAQPLPRKAFQFLRAPALCELLAHRKIVLLDRLKSETE